ncbi:MAG: DNA starvation/stationary phase protection protein [Gammaproteobacteria bacterium]
MKDKIPSQLQSILTATHALQLKTQEFHWNVRGPLFFALHDAFEVQYRALFEAVDEIAERIRALGGTPHLRDPGPRGTGGEIDATSMLAVLAEGHDSVIESIRPLLAEVEGAGDDVTADLLGARLTDHEKQRWMLESARA